jgi:hypothetical protein
MADNLQNWQNATDNRFDFAKNAYLEAIPSLANANATAESVSTINGANALNMGGLADTLVDRVGDFNDLQDQYSASAFGYNSADRQKQVSDRAAADVSSKFDATQQEAQRQLSRRGVNPASGRQLALTNQLGLAKASAMAAASNKARQDLDNTADERQKTAIKFGDNLPNQITSLGQGSVYAGNSAVNAATAPLTNRLNFAGGISNIYGNAADGYKSIYSTTNLTPAQQAEQARLAQRDSDSADAAWLSTIGSVLNSKSGQSFIDKGVDAVFKLFG